MMMSSSSSYNPAAQAPNSKVSVVLYFAVVIGSVGVVLTLYNVFVLCWCVDRRRRVAQSSIPLTRTTARPASTTAASTTTTTTTTRVVVLPTSFVYVKENEKERECAVCLSGLEEGEEVRRLPRCTHSFHAGCIDTWLFSHADCPLCRTPLV